jgi:hypothetical protein
MQQGVYKARLIEQGSERDHSAPGRHAEASSVRPKRKRRPDWPTFSGGEKDFFKKVARSKAGQF